jgi:hypothetical protein
MYRLDAGGKTSILRRHSALAGNEHNAYNHQEKEVIMVNNNEQQPAMQLAAPEPDPALKRLERLVGNWTISGRTLDSEVDNIHGSVNISWLPGAFFLEQRGELHFMGLTVLSLEIVGYDPSTGFFSSHVYSNMDVAPGRYYWDVVGDVVTHWTEAATYTGTISADGKVISGGWRPKEGMASEGNAAYDATMTRVAGSL